MIATGASSLTAAIAAPALAQNSPGSFSLPTPTPTPTPAPQGPVDIRDGVVIGPRPIPETRAQPSPERSPSPTPTSAPTQSGDVAPDAQATRRISGQTPRPTIATVPVVDPPQTNAASRPSSENSPTTREEAEPGFSDDILQAGSEASESTAQEGMQPDAQARTDIPVSSGIPRASSQTLIAIAFSALLTAIAALGCWLWRRRKKAVYQPELIATPAFAAGASIVGAQGGFALTNGKDTQQPRAAPLPAGDAGPVMPAQSRLELTLDIVSASRSLMMFTITYRLNIANRSDRALRDLLLGAQLVCARNEAARNAAHTGEPTQTVERIGPHQSRTITGEVQLPLHQINPMRQGSTPLFIPLLMIAIQTQSGQPAKSHNFVIGAPSAAASTRLHPIALDTPPGGIPDLRAQEIKDAPAGKAT